MKQDFFELLKRLHQTDVSFVLIGGFAATTYGCTLFTQDIDLCCDFSPENLMRLQKALNGLHPVHRMTPNRKPLELTLENAAGLKNLYLDTDLGTLDCLSFVEGIGDFGQALKASREIETDGLTLSILTIDALIRTKEVMRRPRDQQAVIQLKAIREQMDQNNK
jgi:hypothetical protein